MAQHSGVGNHFIQGSLQFADVILSSSGNEIHHIIRHGCSLGVGLKAKNGDTGFQVWGLHIGQEPPLKS